MITFLYNLIHVKDNVLKVKNINYHSVLKGKEFNGIIKLATFNIAHGRGTAKSNWSKKNERIKRLSAIASLLKEKNIDITVLNEVDFESTWSGNSNQAEIIAQEAGFKYVVEQRNYVLGLPFLKLKFGNALLSRFPIKKSVIVELHPYSRFESFVFGKKNGLISDVSITKDLSVKIFSAHLDHRSENTRVQCAKKIIDYAHKSLLPFLLIGDFNSSPSYFPNAEVDSSGLSAMDIILRSGLFSTLPTEKPSYDQMTFSSANPSQVIDWILVPKDWDILYYEVPDIKLSDHRPVIIYIRIKNEDG